MHIARILWMCERMLIYYQKTVILLNIQKRGDCRYFKIIKWKENRFEKEAGGFHNRWEDGPTIIFTAGKSKKKSLKNKLRNYLKQRKRKKAEKKIVLGEHSLEEVVTYAMNRYSVAEVERNEKRYMERWSVLKENLVLKYKPELLGDMQEISKPDIQNEESIRNFFHQIEIRSERIAQIPDNEVVMDFHVYEIRTEEGCLNLEIDYHWKTFGISYSGSKKAIKQFKKIARDLYIYYGVNGNDIREKSERYLSLLEWM